MDKRLGRGLDSLISRTVETPGEGEVAQLPLDAIRVNPNQPRTEMDEDSLQGLAASIRLHGVLQPIIVRKDAAGYELVAGERRFRASRLAGKTEIPALVARIDGARSLEFALIENIQRENLGALDEAAAYEQLAEELGLTHHDLAERVGKSRTTVTNALRLLELPAEVKVLLRTGKLSAGQARALLGAGGKSRMVSLAEEAARDGWTVRDVERQVRKAKASSDDPTKRPDPPGGTKRPMKNKAFYEEELRALFGTKVSINDAGGRGEVRLAFYSAEDRDRLVHMLLSCDATTSEL